MSRSYLDSQMISPGASYTLEMVYNGSGNRNKMSATRFSTATSTRTSPPACGPCGEPTTCLKAARNWIRRTAFPCTGRARAADGEIIAGTPTPALVPHADCRWRRCRSRRCHRQPGNSFLTRPDQRDDGPVATGTPIGR